MVVHKPDPVQESESGSVFDIETESKADMEDAYEDLLATLTDMVITGGDSDAFEKLMDTLTAVGSYSAKNKFLISIQDEEAVGPFNGYNQWVDEFGRVPEEGSSALWVLAPTTVTYCDNSGKKAKDCDDCGDVCEESYTAVVGYKGVPSFAYSQTVELPDEDKPDDVTDVSVISEKETQTQNSDARITQWYESLVTLYESDGLDVTEVTQLEQWNKQTSARGYFQPGSREITIRNFRVGNESEPVDKTERLTTLIHEMAHSYLSHGEHALSSGKQEMEAEAVAYVVCERLGIETDAGVYIASHLSAEVTDVTDRETVENTIEGSVNRIGEVSSKLLDGIRQS